MTQQALTLFDVPPMSDPQPASLSAPPSPRPKGMSSHQSAAMETDEWLTDPKIIQSLGEFDLDPCAPSKRPWDMAKLHYSLPQNGLELPWEGRIWLNPPYGRHIGRWMKKIAHHANGVSLVFARTETSFWHQWIWKCAGSILFIEGRLHFFSVEGIRAKNNGGAPSALIAYGRRNVEALGDCGIKGEHVLLRAMPIIVVGISPSWKSVISIALDRSDGQATVQEIYDLVELIAPDKCIKNQHWKPKVRQKLQECFTRISKGQYRQREIICIEDIDTPC